MSNHKNQKMKNYKNTVQHRVLPCTGYEQPHPLQAKYAITETQNVSLNNVEVPWKVIEQ